MDAPIDFQLLASLPEKDLQNLFGVRDFFVYGISFTSLANATSATGSFTIQTDSNFLWQAGAMQVDTTGTVNATPLITATITDASSGRQLMNAGIALPNLFGTGQLPFLLPTPRFFRGGTQITVVLTNYSTNVTYTNVYLSFIGTKFFKFAQAI